VAQSIDVPGMEFLRCLPALQASSMQGDMLDSLVVALDLLQKRSGGKNKAAARRRIFLVTDASGPIRGVQDMDRILDQLKELDCKLDVMYAPLSEIISLAVTIAH
jgi:hypothetical protein